MQFLRYAHRNKRHAIGALSVCLLGCTGGEPVEPVAPARGAASLCRSDAAPEPYPEPGAWEANHGPGAGKPAFTSDELFTGCTFLDGGERDTSDHHNLVTMYDGYLLMPWAPEWAGGGITLWDVSEPCAPATVGYGISEFMRETHSIGFSSIGGRWAVVNYLGAFNIGGAQFWDLSDPTAPEAVSTVEVDGFVYPDAYARVSLSVFWQAPYLYIAGADNGIYVVDATDPLDPFVVNQIEFEPVLRAGQVQAVGNLLIVTEAEGPRTVLLDLSTPEDPQPIGGGDFTIEDGSGVTRESYFSNIGGGYVYYARKDDGGGLIVYDIHDPSSPKFAGDVSGNGNGGYVFVKDDIAFVGEGNFAAAYDISDLQNIELVTDAFTLAGDLDTITPIANYVVLSVDDEANDDEGSAIVPFTEAPDETAPHVTWVHPPDGEQSLAVTSRFGVTFNEQVDVKSAWVGSVRLYATDLGADAGRVDGVVSAQENAVSFVPSCRLAPGTRYTLEIPAGGIIDFSGNPTAETFTATFETAGG